MVVRMRVVRMKWISLSVAPGNFKHRTAPEGQPPPPSTASHHRPVNGFFGSTTTARQKETRPVTGKAREDEVNGQGASAILVAPPTLSTKRLSSDAWCRSKFPFEPGKIAPNGSAPPPGTAATLDPHAAQSTSAFCAIRAGDPSALLQNGAPEVALDWPESVKL